MTHARAATRCIAGAPTQPEVFVMTAYACSLLRLIAALVAAMGLLVGSGSASANAQGLAALQSPAHASSRAVTKLLVVVEENQSPAQMKVDMPYAFSLAQRFGYATSYHAISHPSLPNYLAIVSGRTHAVADDGTPGAHRLTGRTVFGQALAHGRTAAVYADGMRTACSTKS